MNEKKIADIEDLECVQFCHFKEETITEFGHYMEFQNCQFEKIIFEGNFEGTVFRNVTFKECRFSNAQFYGSSFIKTSFLNCNLIGTNFSNSTFVDTEIVSAKANYSNFNSAIFKHTKLEENDFSEAGFSNVELEQTQFQNNRLIRADFHNTSLKKIDFRTNEIEGMIVNLEDLSGVIMTTNQAISFFPLLGIVVKEERE